MNVSALRDTQLRTRNGHSAFPFPTRLAIGDLCYFPIAAAFLFLLDHQHCISIIASIYVDGFWSLFLNSSFDLD